MSPEEALRIAKQCLPHIPFRLIEEEDRLLFAFPENSQFMEMISFLEDRTQDLLNISESLPDIDSLQEIHELSRVIHALTFTVNVFYAAWDADRKKRRKMR